MAEFRLETERLVLREWREADVEPLNRINSDPEVMEFIGPLRSHSENLDLIGTLNAMQAEYGYSCWAMERRGDGVMIGFCGFHPGAARTPVAGEIEIAWRLGRDAWGQGFAKEGRWPALTGHFPIFGPRRFGQRRSPPTSGAGA